MYMDILLACISVYHMCAWCHGGYKRTVDPEMGAADSTELSSQPWSSAHDYWAVSPFLCKIGNFNYQLNW